VPRKEIVGLWNLPRGGPKSDLRKKGLVCPSSIYQEEGRNHFEESVTRFDLHKYEMYF